MNDLYTLERREELEAWLRRDPGLHIYELGDLDPFFWPHTHWFGLREGGPQTALRALAMLYTGARTPTLLALTRDDAPPAEALIELLKGLTPRLPDRLYAHLGPGLGQHLEAAGFCAHGRSTHLKLVLPTAAHTGLPHDTDTDTEQVRLGPQDLDELLALYARSYPDNWFDPRMLATGQYLGMRRGGELVCVAGVHVYSPRYAVAALGNVTTAPTWRGQGLARRAVAGLSRQLLSEVDVLGLNVHADNAAALACYRKLGFETLTRYEEWVFGRS